MARVAVSDEQWHEAKLQWESDPMVEYSDIAKKLGVTRQAVQLRSKRKGWQRRLDRAAVAEMAHAAADSKFTHLVADSPGQASPVYANPAEIGARAPIARALPEVPSNVPADQVGAAMERAAVDKRSEVLTTHRRELTAMRTVLYKAMKATDIEEAKRAKILAEGMRVMQDGERKAWGLEPEPSGKPPGAGVTVNVNRRVGGKVAR